MEKKKKKNNNLNLINSISSIELERLVEQMKFVLSIPLFRGWTSSEIKKLEEISEIVEYQHNEVIYEEGDAGPFHFYQIIEGNFRIHRKIWLDSKVTSIDKQDIILHKYNIQIANNNLQQIYQNGQLAEL